MISELDLHNIFTRWCARIPRRHRLWPAPPVVVEWLDTGDPELKAEAQRATLAAVLPLSTGPRGPGHLTQPRKGHKAEWAAANSALMAHDPSHEGWCTMSSQLAMAWAEGGEDGVDDETVAQMARIVQAMQYDEWFVRGFLSQTTLAPDLTSLRTLLPELTARELALDGTWLLREVWKTFDLDPITRQVGIDYCNRYQNHD